MRRSFFTLIMSAIIALFVGCQSKTERTIVILSTNDIHAQIDGFPALATAIQMCRDTAEVILVDGGDKFTGNAFVDLVEHHTPIFELMNKVGYDVGVLGNHEFDWGHEYLVEANKQAEFENILANVVSATESFPQPQPYAIVERNGVKVAFVGIVINDTNGHPSGKDTSYEGITFIDPDKSAAQYNHLRESGECDVLVLLSHSGVDREREYAASEKLKGYDMIIGAHSHSVVNEVINGIQVAQTGSRLKSIGATVITTIKGEEPQISYRNIPLDTYTPNAEVAQMVEVYLNNPELTSKIGTASAKFSKNALKNLFTSTIKSGTSADIGFYHSGGVRLGAIEQGDISTATILNMEPFGSTVVNFEMTPEQMKGMVMAKFNDAENVGESHYIDLSCTEPYEIITNDKGDAIDVVFPTLKIGKSYKVAIGDYIALTYKGLEYKNKNLTGILITDLLKKYVSSKSSVSPDNNVYQSIK